MAVYRLNIKINKEELIMKKSWKFVALILCMALLCALAACGPAENPGPSQDPGPTQGSDDPAGNNGEGSVYTTKISDADVTITLSADKKSASVSVMGMVVEGACEVADNTLTFKEQTSGNAQVWAGLAANTYTLNDDGTATAAAAGSDGVYTININGADVTFTLSADQKSITVDAMGMTVEGSCEVADGVLTFKDQTSGNAQIWTSLGANTYTLNDDGTAAIVTAE